MTRNLEEFEEYDMNKINKAKQLLVEVYGYYYGFSPMNRKVKRLETIIKKIDELKN